MLVNIKKVKKMAMERMSGLMAANTLVTGKIVTATETVLLLILMAVNMLVNLKMVKRMGAAP